MAILVVVMVVTALWIVLGAVLHGGHDVTAEAAGQAWWWDACQRSTSVAWHGALPASHPLARLRESPSPNG